MLKKVKFAFGGKKEKIKLGILAGIVAFVLFGTVVAVEAVAFQGNGKANTPDLEKIEFIHWKKGFGKPEWAKAPKAPACYKFLTPTKIRWTVLPVNYVINPTNPQNLSESFVGSAVYSSAETWDASTTKELMNDSYTIDYAAAYGVQNYQNAIAFGNYPTVGVIAVTTVWYNPATKAIVEFDIMFDTDWTWGDATVDPTKMDLQNIAVHELGHGVGLSDYGEIKKRTLEEPDIKGLLTLYPM